MNTFTTYLSSLLGVIAEYNTNHAQKWRQMCCESVQPVRVSISEVTFFQNWYFSCAAWNVFPINSLGRVSAPLGPPSSGITGLHHLVHYCYIKWDCRLTKFFDITVSIIYLIVMQWRDFFRLVSVLEIFFSLPGMRCKTRKIGFYKQIETSGAVGI